MATATIAKCTRPGKLPGQKWHFSWQLARTQWYFSWQLARTQCYFPWLLPRAQFHLYWQFAGPYIGPLSGQPGPLLAQPRYLLVYLLLLLLISIIWVPLPAVCASGSFGTYHCQRLIPKWNSDYLLLYYLGYRLFAASGSFGTYHCRRLIPKWNSDYMVAIGHIIAGGLFQNRIQASHEPHQVPPEPASKKCLSFQTLGGKFFLPLMNLSI